MLGALFGAYPAVIRLLGEDSRFSSGDGEIGRRDLKDLGVVQFAVIVAMTECLETILLSGIDVTLVNELGETCRVSWFASVLDFDVATQAAPCWHLGESACGAARYLC